MQEGTSKNSTYVWEVGNTFTITPSNVGVPLEFRIGKREGSNQLDALVLDLDLSLTPAELDALFAPMFDPGDFNEDGFVDGNDLLVLAGWIWNNHSATRLQGDADDDGDVDGADFLIWQRGYTGPAPLPPQTVAVPERSGMTLCLIGLLVSASLRQERQLIATLYQE